MSYFVKIPTVKNHKVNKFYLFTLMVAKRCRYNKHFTVTANDTVGKRYFNNIIILSFNFHAI